MPVKKLSLHEVLDEVLPLLKQKYVVPRFEGIADVSYTIGKVPRKIPTIRKAKQWTTQNF
jgi:hypothetical protein